MSNEESTGTAEALLAAFLTARDEGRSADFESLCGAHPREAERLRELKREFDEAQVVFARLGLGEIVEASLEARVAAARGEAACSQAEHAALVESTTPLLERLRELGPAPARYTRLGELNRGGMGAIVKVEDRLMRRTLALKEMLAPADEHARARQRARFLEEAELTGRLEHPGIVPVHEMGLSSENGEPFFTMKLVKGRDLGAIYEESARGDGEWTQTRVVQDVLLRVCETMSYAHARGVIHRDLKPSNVMVGEYGEVYVMDWGLARALGSSELRATEASQVDPTAGTSPTRALTHAGHRLGTPEYMAPEQARGDHAAVGPATDVYAVGVMLYRLLSGRSPYVATGERISASEVLARVVAGPPGKLERVAPRVPLPLVAICEKAMAREIADRYASMSALAQDLRAFVERRVVAAYEVGAWAEAKTWVRRNRALSTAVAAVLVALLAGLALALVLKQRADEYARLAQVSADRATRVKEMFWQVLIGADPSRGGLGSVTVVEAMLSARTLLDGGELGSDPEMQTELRLMVAQVLEGLGRAEEALPIALEALRVCERAHPEDHPLVADCLDVLASSTEVQGDVPEALCLYERARAIRERLFDGDHADIAISLNNVACCLESMDRAADALPLFEASLAMRQRLIPPDDESIATAMDNLGNCLDTLDRVDEARLRFESALAIRVRLYDGDRSELAYSLNSVGLGLGRCGRYDESLARHEAALAMRRRVFKGDHPLTATSLNNTAGALESVGQRERAEELYEEALAMLLRIHDDDHPNVATTLDNLGYCLNAMGRSAEALPYYDQALEMRRRLAADGVGEDVATSLQNMAGCLRRLEWTRAGMTFMEEALAMAQRIHGAEHSDVADAHAGLAAFLEEDDRSAEALPLFEEALATRRCLFGPESPDFAVSAGGLADCLMSLGRYDEALSYYLAAQRIWETLTDGNDERVANALDETGVCLAKLDRNAAALESFEAAFATRRELFTGDHPDIALSLSQVSTGLRAVGRIDEALTRGIEALEMRRRLHPGNHARVATSLNNVAAVLSDLGRHDEALAMYEQSLSMRRALLGDVHSDVAASLSNIGTELATLGRHAEARVRFEEALRIREQIFSEDHPDTVVSIYKLATCLGDLGEFADAKALAERAEAMAARCLPVGHPNRVHAEETAARLRADR